MEDSDTLIGNGQCESVLLHSACCYDGGDCGCPSCLEPSDALRVGDGQCDADLSRATDCCMDGGDCHCLIVRIDNYCCSEQSPYCFPPESLCPTCSLDVFPLLTNGVCDYVIAQDEACCYDSIDCDFFLEPGENLAPY